MPECRRPALDDPRLLPFLPLLYIAWADGDLADDEIRDICARVSSTEGLEIGCGDLLGRWLDPGNPPSASELQALLIVLRRGASELEDGERRSLSGLGLELARRGGGSPAEPEERALAEVERALGLVGTDLSGFFQPARRKEGARRVEPSFDVEAMTRRLDGDHPLEHPRAGGYFGEGPESRSNLEKGPEPNAVLLTVCNHTLQPRLVDLLPS